MIDGRIKLRHIACFLEVAARGGFGRAAEALALTQPAVSKAIGELEETLGVTLFERGRGGAVLTPHGDAFRMHAAAARAALTRGLETIAEARGGVGRLIAIGVLPTATTGLMPRAVARAKADGLAATIRVEAGPNDWLLSRLREGRLDLVVGRLAGAEAMRGLAFEHLYSEEIVAVARAGHPLAQGATIGGAPTGGAPIGLSDLAPFTLLLPTADSIIRPEVDRLFLAEGVTRTTDLIETVAPAFGRAYVRGTEAVWIISRGVVAEDLAAGDLVRLPLSSALPGGPVGLTTRVGGPLDGAVAMLAAAVRQAAEG